jgi:hypothetical protein
MQALKFAVAALLLALAAGAQAQWKLSRSTSSSPLRAGRLTRSRASVRAS